MTVSKSSASASKKLDEVLKLTGPTDFVLLCACWSHCICG